MLTVRHLDRVIFLPIHYPGCRGGKAGMGILTEFACPEMGMLGHGMGIYNTISRRLGTFYHAMLAPG